MNSKGAFRLVGLAVLVESVKPLADIMRDHIRHDRFQNCEKVHHETHPPPIEVGGSGRKTSITHFSTKRNTNEHIPPARGRKPLPLGEVSAKQTERASPSSREPPRSDKQALRQSDTIAALMILRQHPCPLSLAPLASSPKGRAFGKPVSSVNFPRSA